MSGYVLLTPSRLRRRPVRRLLPNSPPPTLARRHAKLSAAASVAFTSDERNKLVETFKKMSGDNRERAGRRFGLRMPLDGDSVAELTLKTGTMDLATIRGFRRFII